MSEAARGTRQGSAWLFGPAQDLGVFVLPAVLALGLTFWATRPGSALQGETSPWVWLVAVLGVDVAHVWSTFFRVYADGREVARRRGLYLGAPLALYLGGVGLHVVGPMTFWRVLAYAAVFHFVRQQYGWLKLYHRQAGGSGAWERGLDVVTLHLSMLYPLLAWHASLPRRFHWLMPGDFVRGLPAWVARSAGALEVASLGLYALLALGRAAQGKPIPWGKHLLVGTTAACWYVGIVALDSDTSFTLTNVLIHGIPYLMLTWRYGSRRYGPGDFVAPLFRLGVGAFYAALVAVAFVEESLWDGWVWHDHPQFFGSWGTTLGPLTLALVVPLLALPQATHYLLDGFIWRGGAHNPGLVEQMGWGDSREQLRAEG